VQALPGAVVDVNGAGAGALNFDAAAAPVGTPTGA